MKTSGTIRSAIAAGMFSLAAAAAAQTMTGEATPPLRIVHRVPVTLAHAAAPVSEVPLPVSVEGGEILGSAGGTAYFGVAGQIYAIDVPTGRERWTSLPLSLTNEAVAIGPTNIFVGASSKLVVLSRASGHITSLPDIHLGSLLGGVIYAQYHSGYEDEAFVAYDATTLKRLWTSYGGGQVMQEDAFVYGRNVFQIFNSTGPPVGARLYAFDAHRGTGLWSTSANASPLGFGNQTLYLDATNYPANVDQYRPLTVDAIDAATGRHLRSYTYAPDPARNAPTFRSSYVPAHLAGSFVYLSVNQSWYRYDVDLLPRQAHPVRLDQIIDIPVWFSGTSLLLTTPHGVAIGNSLPDRMEMQALGTGTLRSSIATRKDGTRYAVVGETLVAFDPRGRARAVGSVRCGEIHAILAWSSRVAVHCSEANGRRNRMLIFADWPET